VVVEAVGGGTSEARPPVDRKVVAVDVDSGAQRSKSLGGARNPIRLLVPQLAGAADDRRPRGLRGREAEDGDLVDGRGDVSRGEVDAPQVAGADRDVGDGLANIGLGAAFDRPLLDVGAHRSKDVDDGAARWVDADAPQRKLGVRVDGRGDQPERGRRNVARYSLAHRSHGNPSFETDRHRSPDPANCPGHDRDAPRPQHPLRMVTGRDRLANRCPSLRSQPREQDRRLDLGARHWRRDVHRLKRGATDHGHRREGVVRSGVEHRTHRAQRFDDTSDRSATQ
jgi:hypothetical protein